MTTTIEIDTGWRGASLPALVRAVDADDVDPVEWAGGNAPEVGRLARTAGAVLLRGFAVTDHAIFGAMIRALSSRVLPYGERSSPRTRVADDVYTSTEYPAQEPIVAHHEQSYTIDWPTRIAFFCERPALRGGRTPLVDSRRVLARLDPRIVERFRRTGVRYVRNYLPGISLSWQEAFQTTERAEVEAYCRAADIAIRWVDDEQLRTIQVRPAVRTHPVTGQESWFNHAHFFHVSSLPTDVVDGLTAALDEDDLPYNTYYGDGEPIEPDVLTAIRSAIVAETVAFDWEEQDVLVVDNMLTLHGREPFEGPRRVLTAMADPISGATG